MKFFIPALPILVLILVYFMRVDVAINPSKEITDGQRQKTSVIHSKALPTQLKNKLPKAGIAEIEQQVSKEAMADNPTTPEDLRKSLDIYQDYFRRYPDLRKSSHKLLELSFLIASQFEDKEELTEFEYQNLKEHHPDEFAKVCYEFYRRFTSFDYAALKAVTDQCLKEKKDPMIILDLIGVALPKLGLEQTLKLYEDYRSRYPMLPPAKNFIPVEGREKLESDIRQFDQN